MKPERIRELLRPYLSPLPGGIEYKVQKYMALLQRWGARMPLTSIHDPEAIVRFHFGESIFALEAATIKNGRLADVGSGAGFPGLPIKLANPGLSVILIESNRKKCAFLHEVTRSLELDNVQIVSSEFESSPIDSDSLSFVTSRALRQHKRILDWAHEKLACRGSVLLWIGLDDATVIRSLGSWDWGAPRLIPGTRSRFLLPGGKMS
ncbi:MAG TPA: 16S rRNA (guanine(527)-N(7))-methyltransferase RsmG [Candidatus Acidoferrales bacterium]|nr:16S rRNA (guanine(527)-N(7))-methyltransferase RsmG [Candidatus Acidoferrales bacterium]